MTTKHLRLVAPASVVLGAILAVVGPAAAQTPQAAGVTVYAAINVSGANQGVSERAIGISATSANAEVSSPRRIDGGGIASQQSVDEGKGGSRGDRDRRSAAQYGLIFFDRPYFRGATTPLTLESRNTRIGGRGSVQIMGPGIWELCDHRGRCATIDRDVPNLFDLRLSERITSVRELPPPPSGVPPSVVAGARVGDRVTRQVTIRQEGQPPSLYEIELALTRLNAEDGSVLLNQTMNGVVSQKWLAPAAQHNNAQFEELVTACRDIGGTPEHIRVPAGRFATCRFRHSDENQDNTYWVGQVPFGTVKSETRWRPNGKVEVQELESVSGVEERSAVSSRALVDGRR